MFINLLFMQSWDDDINVTIGLVNCIQNISSGFTGVVTAKTWLVTEVT